METELINQGGKNLRDSTKSLELLYQSSLWLLSLINFYKNGLLSLLGSWEIESGIQREQSASGNMKKNATVVTDQKPQIQQGLEVNSQISKINERVNSDTKEMTSEQVYYGLNILNWQQWLTGRSILNVVKSANGGCQGTN